MSTRNINPVTVKELNEDEQMLSKVVAEMFWYTLLLNLPTAFMATLNDLESLKGLCRVTNHTVRSAM